MQGPSSHYQSLQDGHSLEPTGLPQPNIPPSSLTVTFFEAMVPFIFPLAMINDQGAWQ